MKAITHTATVIITIMSTSTTLTEDRIPESTGKRRKTITGVPDVKER